MSRGGAGRDHGPVYDPTLTFTGNGQRAWAQQRAKQRAALADETRKTFRRITGEELPVDVQFDNEALGIDVPHFVLDGMLYAGGNGALYMIELCSQCGGDPLPRGFDSLAGLGQQLEQLEDAMAHVCGSCAAEHRASVSP